MDGGCIFTCVPVHLQHVAAGLLQDRLWLDNKYFPSNLARLRASYDFAVEKLARLNIKVYPAKVRAERLRGNGKLNSLPGRFVPLGRFQSLFGVSD